jgi:hypothetical protein
VLFSNRKTRPAHIADFRPEVGTFAPALARNIRPGLALKKLPCAIPNHLFSFARPKFRIYQGAVRRDQVVMKSFGRSFSVIRTPILGAPAERVKPNGLIGSAAGTRPVSSLHFGRDDKLTHCGFAPHPSAAAPPPHTSANGRPQALCQAPPSASESRDQPTAASHSPPSHPGNAPPTRPLPAVPADIIHTRSLLAEHRHANAPPVVKVTNQVLRRHLDVIERDLVEPVRAGHVDGRPDLHAGRIHVH